jgi:hypothetical protein
MMKEKELPGPGWRCPQCRTPLQLEAETVLRCPKPECRWILPRLLSLNEAAEIPGFSMKKIGKLLESGALRFRVQRDVNGRVCRKHIDSLDLFELRKGPKECGEKKTPVMESTLG